MSGPIGNSLLIILLTQGNRPKGRSVSMFDRALSHDSFAGLEIGTLKGAIDRMAKRAFVASPAHLLAYLAIMASSPEYLFSLIGLSSAVTFFLAIPIRFYLWRNSGRWIQSKTLGLQSWRLAFGACAWLLALAWGFSSAQTIYFEGLSDLSLMLMAAGFGVSAISIPAFAFDLRTNMIFQLLISSIPASAFVVSQRPEGAFWIVVSYIAWIGFMIYTVRSTNSAQIELLSSRETIESQSRLLAKTHSDLQNMLDSLDEAYLSVDMEGVIRVSQTNRGIELFGMDPTNLRLADVFQFRDSDEKSDFEEWYRQLVSPSPILPFDEWIKMGTDERLLNNGKTLKLRFSPIRNTTGALERVVVTAVDISREVAIRRAALAEKNRSEMILRVHDHRAEFGEFLHELQRYTSEDSRPVELDQVALRRQLHALKGSARFFGATELSSSIHKAELAIQSDATSLCSALQMLSYEVSNWIAREDKLLSNLRVFSQQMIEVPRDEVDLLPAPLRAQLMSVKMNAILEPLRQHAQTVAQALRKRVEFVVVSDPNLALSHELSRELTRILPHVIVNAVDHGIETPDSRRSAGKPETGRIEIRAGITKDHLGESAIVIRIEDDGNGIDLKRLQAKNGGEGGLDLIFVDGLSSKALKNEYSGFGLGLGHVRAVIRRLGGEVDVERSDSAGTCIRINIPLTEKPIESKAS